MSPGYSLMKSLENEEKVESLRKLAGGENNESKKMEKVFGFLNWNREAKD